MTDLATPRCCSAIGHPLNFILKGPKPGSPTPLSASVACVPSQTFEVKAKLRNAACFSGVCCMAATNRSVWR